MNPLIQFKKASRPLFIALALICTAAAGPKAQAVVPAPDGGYPGGNTAEGTNALLSLTSGTYNTAVGLFSLSALTAGNFCTGVGAGTLLLNTADGNTAVGAAALLSNTSGSGNTATGLSTLGNNTTGIRNTANGVYALNHNISGGGNTAVGYQALVNNTASGNTAIGNDSLVFNSTGFENTAMGAGALAGNTTGQDNTAVGAGALASNGAAFFNNAFGRGALSSHSSGDGNVAVGDSALANHTTGTSNTAIGNSTLVNATTGDFNIALGLFAGQNITGNNNIDIGNGGVAADSNTIRIGNGSHTQAFIAGTFGITTGGAAIPVMIDAGGQLGTMSSSQRFKNEIKPMASASESILALKPVTFHYKSDKTGTPQFGLIAEEVAGVNPDLVVRDKNGEIYTVRYDAVNAMLLNEFLKARRQIDAQQKQIEALTAGLQKVSAQLETSKPAPQMVNNP